MSDISLQEDFQVRCGKVASKSMSLYSKNPNWVQFFTEILGVHGIARELFKGDEFLEFEKSQTRAEIVQMVHALRNSKAKHLESLRVITVRMPESLHEALKSEASNYNISLNRLCITKLLSPAPNHSDEPTFLSNVSSSTVATNPAMNPKPR